MMMKLFFALAALVSFLLVDRDFKYKCDYRQNYDNLIVMLDSASSGKERAEVFWRLSRASLMLGEQAQGKQAKREHFAEGIMFAEKGLAENPESRECHMWHCANVGRDCQTRSLPEQAAAVPAMTKDLTAIIDKLGHTEYSEAWQALSEMYWHHPFKSDESAINFARRAAYCIPPDELRISTCTYFAELLLERGWSAAKRGKTATGNAAKFRNTTDSNIEKYSYYDGSGDRMPWSAKPLGEMSDIEEAAAVLDYAKGLYKSCKELSPVDKKDFLRLMELSEKIGK